MPALTPAENQALAVSMRICGAISLVGCLFIVTTFTFSKRFRRPVNRLIFYASWGNIILAVISIWTIDPISAPYGPGSALCTAQGFMVQMFLPSDVLWNLCMAINVYLTIFKRWEVERMKRLEIYYALANFGLPFIVALSYLFVNDPVKGRVYGPATIWCWITYEWDWLRIAFLYAPAWISILVIFMIYIAAGWFIYDKRRGLNSNRITPPSFKRSSFVPLRDHTDRTTDTDNTDPFTSMHAIKTTHIRITRDEAYEMSPTTAAANNGHNKDSSSTESDSLGETGGKDRDDDARSIVAAPTHTHTKSQAQIADGAAIGAPPRSYEPYSVKIHGGETGRDEEDDDREVDEDEDSIDMDGHHHDDATHNHSIDVESAHTVSPLSPTAQRHQHPLRPATSLSTFSRRNRKLAATASHPASYGGRAEQTAAQLRRRQNAAAAREQRNVAWSYTKVALLYFLSLLSTWVPSSINRVWSVIHVEEISFGLSIAAAIVLPLVGFWNSLIYTVSSWDAVTETWWEVYEWIGERGRRRSESKEAAGNRS